MLIELEQKEEPVKQTAEDSSSCGSRVTLTDDDSPVFPYTFTHHSEINDTPATETQPTVRHYSNDTVFQMVVGDIGIEINGQDFNKSSFEFPSSPVESSYDEHDSGCSMSIGSPLKSLKRPGLIYVPPELSQKISRGQSLEFSSLSTASHPSSICSSSPLSLSPSPTPLLPSSQTAFDGFQQWPDLSTKSATTNSSYPNGATHRPTQEDILRMEQWHSNLLAQLRQQQEKLDQKKKEKEAATESYSLPSQLHMFLPPNGIPPPPLHASLPPLPTHIPPPPLHGPLPPNFFPPFPPLPLHSVPPVFIPPPPPAHMFERHPQSRKNFIHPPPFTSAPKQPSSPVPSQTTYVLNDKWVLWYDKIIGSHKNSFSDYKASLKQICTVTSVSYHEATNYTSTYNVIIQKFHAWILMLVCICMYIKVIVVLFYFHRLKIFGSCSTISDCQVHWKTVPTITSSERVLIRYGRILLTVKEASGCLPSRKALISWTERGWKW